MTLPLRNKYIIRKFNDQVYFIYSYNTGHFYAFECRRVHLYIRKELILNCIELSSNAFNELKQYQLQISDIDFESLHSPIVAGIMIANQCNLSCEYCISNRAGSYSPNSVILANSDLLLNRLNESAIISILISGGEPTIDNNLSSFLEQLPIYSFLCLLDSNGISVSDNLLDVLSRSSIIPRISLDSIDASTHNKNRGGFELTMNNIDRMLNHNIEIRINTVLHKDNVNNIYDLGNWLIKNKIKKWHIFKLRREYSPQRLWISDEQTYEIISNLKKRLGNKIEILYKFAYNNDKNASFLIDSEGICFTTSLDNGPQKDKWGNIFQQSISEIWNSIPIDFRIRHYTKFLFNEGRIATSSQQSESEM